MGRTFYRDICSVGIVTMNIMVGTDGKILIIRILIFQFSSFSLFLVLCVLTPESSTAPTPGGGGLPFADLFLYNPLLGLGLGAAGGVVATGVAGLAAAGAVSEKINTLANVANAKINLINLGASLVESGNSLLGGGKQIIRTQQEYF